MAHNKKEDEKIEKMIRGILKLPENRRCINCNSLGPQYVCTTFLTFICTNCSGIHREFTHRVKSISMAKFTFDEVDALLAAGNECASRIYFKTWDPNRHSKPDGRDLYKLRTFIKHVYVDRKYTGGSIVENPRPSEKEDFGENRNRGGAYGSNIPNYVNRRSGFRGRSDEGILRFYYEEGRNPGYYSFDKPRSGMTHRRSSARFEVVDDRVRDDDSGNSKRPPRLMSAEFKLRGMSLDVQNKADKANSLEANRVTMKAVNSKISKIGEKNSEPNEAKVTDSRSSTSNNLKPPEPIPQPANDGGNWTSFDSSVKETTPSKPSNLNTLEALLFELSTPAPTPASELELAIVPILIPEPKTSSIEISNLPDQVAEPKESTELGPRNAYSPGISSVAFDVQSSGTDSVMILDIEPIPQRHDTILPTSIVETDERVPPSTALSSDVVKTAQEMIRVEVSRSTVPVLDFSARKELPADLFTAMYAPTPALVQGWYDAPPHGYGYSLPYYPNPTPNTTYPNAARSSNPFDVADEPPQGGFHNMSAQLSTPSLGGRPLGLRPPQIPPHVAVVQPQPPSHMASYMGQEGFGAVNPNQPITMRYSAPPPTAAYPPSAGGNPFG